VFFPKYFDRPLLFSDAMCALTHLTKRAISNDLPDLVMVSQLAFTVNEHLWVNSHLEAVDHFNYYFST